MNRWVTIVGAATLVVLEAGQLVWAKRMTAEMPRYASGEAAAQIARTLDLAEGLDRGGDPWPPLTWTRRDSPRAMRIRMVSFLRALEAEHTDDLRLLLALVLLESFRHGELDEVSLIAGLPELSEADRSAVAAAYPGWAPAAGTEAGSHALTPGWPGDILEMRTAEVAGDPARAAAAQARILARAESELAPNRRLVWLRFVLAVAGLGLAGAIVSGFIPLPERTEPAGFAIPPWDGAGLFVRAQLIQIAAGLLVPVYLAIVGGGVGITLAPLQLEEVLGCAAALAYANAALRRSQAATSLRAVTGIHVSPLSAAALGLALFAISSVLDYLGRVLDLLTASAQGGWVPPLPHFAGESATRILGAVIAAPITEEILFRGILFAALRSTLGFWAAAGISAAAFSIGHERSPGGYLALMAWAVLFAFVYERTRTLLPLMLSHALSNLLVVVGRL